MIITLNQTTASTHVQSNDSFSRDDWQIMKQKERDNYRLSSSLVLEQRTLRSSKKRSPLNFFSVFFHTFKGIPIDLTVDRSLWRCSCFSLISRFVKIENHKPNPSRVLLKSVPAQVYRLFVALGEAHWWLCFLEGYRTVAEISIQDLLSNWAQTFSSCFGNCKCHRRQTCCTYKHSCTVFIF